MNKIELIAEIVHEANRAYCDSLGDKSQPTWEDAPEWQKSSARNGVNFVLMNPNAGYATLHNQWLQQKKEEGWQYGTIKDANKKEHPCLLPWHELPREQKMKDVMFREIVLAASRALDWDDIMLP